MIVKKLMYVVNNLVHTYISTIQQLFWFIFYFRKSASIKCYKKKNVPVIDWSTGKGYESLKQTTVETPYLPITM